ncbi:hypothetical protein K438DRAFT_1993096 [Mycena galopus ATCC 62051]|nr:hypothetical protein K438DRAFT_1993096 [Mycena galopus ATCC 62051]
MSSEDEMAPPKTVELFRGNCISEKEEKLYQFERGLPLGGQADEWWEDLKASEKDTWRNLLTAFEKKWPKPRAMRRATEAIIEEIKSNSRPPRARQGKGKLLMELPNGDEAKLLKSHVHATLPVAFHCLINDASLVTEACEEYKTLHPTSSRTASASHTSAHHASEQLPSPPTAGSDTLRYTSTSCQWQHLMPAKCLHKKPTPTQFPCQPVSGERTHPTSLSGDPVRDADTACVLAQNTQGPGRAPALQSAWMSQYGNSLSPDYASFPFTPGTFAPGSRKCYQCGLLTAPPHYGQSACQSLGNPEVPTRELNIRTIVGQIIYPPRQCSMGISQIYEVSYNLFGNFDPNQPLYDAQLENGEEPTD